MTMQILKYKCAAGLGAQKLSMHRGAKILDCALEVTSWGQARVVFWAEADPSMDKECEVPVRLAQTGEDAPDYKYKHLRTLVSEVEGAIHVYVGATE